MSAHNALRNGLGVAFNVLSTQFAPNVVIKLCVVSGDYDEFDLVLTVASKRMFEFRENRQKVFLEIADDSTALTTAIQQATHIKIDDDLYRIQTGDTLPSKGMDVTWKLFGNRELRSGAATYSPL